MILQPINLVCFNILKEIQHYKLILISISIHMYKLLLDVFVYVQFIQIKVIQHTVLTKYINLRQFQILNLQLGNQFWIILL